MSESELSEETKKIIQAMDEATWKAVEGYRVTGLKVPVYDWEQKKVLYLSVEGALARRSDYAERMADKTANEASHKHD